MCRLGSDDLSFKEWYSELSSSVCQFILQGTELKLTLWDVRLNLISRAGDRFTLKGMAQICIVGHAAWPEDLRCGKRLILRVQHGAETWPMDLAIETVEQQAPTRFRELFDNFRTKILPLFSVCQHLSSKYCDDRPHITFWAPGWGNSESSFRISTFFTCGEECKLNA
jgi:hypothetical protein